MLASFAESAREESGSCNTKTSYGHRFRNNFSLDDELDSFIEVVAVRVNAESKVSVLCVLCQGSDQIFVGEFVHQVKTCVIAAVRIVPIVNEYALADECVAVALIVKVLNDSEIGAIQQVDVKVIVFDLPVVDVSEGQCGLGDDFAVLWTPANSPGVIVVVVKII